MLSWPFPDVDVGSPDLHELWGAGVRLCEVKLTVGALSQHFYGNMCVSSPHHLYVFGKERQEGKDIQYSNFKEGHICLMATGKVVKS